MTFNVQTPFLITSRKFPQDKVELEPILTKSYTEVAQAVNSRTIGLYEKVQITIGDRYFSDGDPQNRRQAFRKVFTFGAIAAGATSIINHEISGITKIVYSHGECTTEVPDFRSIPYSSATVVTDQIQRRVTSTQIFITNGATAPNITDGIFVLEYLLN